MTNLSTHWLPHDCWNKKARRQPQLKTWPLLFNKMQARNMPLLHLHSELPAIKLWRMQYNQKVDQARRWRLWLGCYRFGGVLPIFVQLQAGEKMVTATDSSFTMTPFLVLSQFSPFKILAVSCSTGNKSSMWAHILSKFLTASSLYLSMSF